MCIRDRYYTVWSIWSAFIKRWGQNIGHIHIQISLAKTQTSKLLLFFTPNLINVGSLFSLKINAYIYSQTLFRQRENWTDVASFTYSCEEHYQKSIASYGTIIPILQSSKNLTWQIDPNISVEFCFPLSLFALQSSSFTSTHSIIYRLIDIDTSLSKTPDGQSSQLYVAAIR